MMKSVKRKVYMAPNADFVELNGIRSICAAEVGIGSKGTPDTGLAKDNKFSFWEDEEEAGSNSKANPWED